MKKNKLLFDFTNNSDSTLLLADGVFGAAILADNSISTFTPILNAKETVKIGIHDFGNVLQAAGCSPSDTGAGTLDDKDVTVCPLDVYFSICQKTLEQSFLSSRLAAGSNNVDFLPAEFASYIKEKLVKTIASNLEKAAWQGDVLSTGSTYPNTLCDGLGYKLNADATVVDVTLTATTSSNVIANLIAVYNAIPTAVLQQPDVVIYAASNVIKAYKQALAAASAEAYYNAKDLTLTFLGIELVEAQLATGQMVATYKSNLFKITDLVNDYEDVRLIPQLDKTGKHQIIVSGSMKWAVDFAVGADVVYFH